MKKTLLATAIAGAVVASGAQAATLYDQDGTKLELYGRISLGISGGGDKTETRTRDIRDNNGVKTGEKTYSVKTNGSEFRDVYSRFGLRGSQRVTSDLTAFGNFELRPNLDEVNRDGQQVRNSYLGLRSNTFGTLQAGNFDSFYLDTVSAPFDVYIDRGLEFTGGSHRARGDSLGYISPELSGFQVYLMGKHYTGNGQDTDSTSSNSSKINTAGGVVYENMGLRLGLGYAEDKDDEVVDGGAGWDENIYGGTVSYEFFDDFSARLGYEYQSENRDVIGVGMSYGIAQWAFNLDYYHISLDGDRKDVARNAGDSTSRDAWAAGAYYNISSNFDVYAEVHEADQASIGSRSDARETRDSVYWLTGVRYFF
ncbi:MAG TPA: porin [Arenicellales bacterium]|nr:porin [Arenicellales bacterium]